VLVEFVYNEGASPRFLFRFARRSRVSIRVVYLVVEWEGSWDKSF